MSTGSSTALPPLNFTVPPIGTAISPLQLGQQTSGLPVGLGFPPPLQNPYAPSSVPSPMLGSQPSIGSSPYGLTSDMSTSRSATSGMFPPPIASQYGITSWGMPTVPGLNAAAFVTGPGLQPAIATQATLVHQAVQFPSPTPQTPRTPPYQYPQQQPQLQSYQWQPQQPTPAMFSPPVQTHQQFNYYSAPLQHQQQLGSHLSAPGSEVLRKSCLIRNCQARTISQRCSEAYRSRCR